MGYLFTDGILPKSQNLENHMCRLTGAKQPFEFSRNKKSYRFKNIIHIIIYLIWYNTFKQLLKMCVFTGNDESVEGETEIGELNVYNTVGVHLE